MLFLRPPLRTLPHCCWIFKQPLKLFCHCRSNWVWDLRKHMKIMHGEEGKVSTFSNEEARRTPDQYKANRRQSGGRLLRWPNTNVSREPSTSRQCYTSEATRDATISPDHNTPRPASNDSTQSSEGNIETASTFRCYACKIIFSMRKNLVYHNAYHCLGLVKANTLAAIATRNAVIGTVTARCSSSSPSESTSSRIGS